jgi:hypothetical protein
MIHLQIIERGSNNLQALIRSAIRSGKITSFEIAKVKGGLKITHTAPDYPGAITFIQMVGLLLVDVGCKNAAKEWQLLGAFVGQLACHFVDEIAAINMQFDPKD